MPKKILSKTDTGEMIAIRDSKPSSLYHQRVHFDLAAHMAQDFLGNILLTACPSILIQTPPDKWATFACDLAESFLKEARKRKWLLDIPGYEEINKLAEEDAPKFGIG